MGEEGEGLDYLNVATASSVDIECMFRLGGGFTVSNRYHNLSPGSVISDKHGLVKPAMLGEGRAQRAEKKRKAEDVELSGTESVRLGVVVAAHCRATL